MTDTNTMIEWPIGARVEPNEYYREQFCQSKVTRGRIVGYPRWSSGVMVKWEERKTKDSLHVQFLRRAAHT